MHEKYEQYADKYGRYGLSQYDLNHYGKTFRMRLASKDACGYIAIINHYLMYHQLDYNLDQAYGLVMDVYKKHTTFLPTGLQKPVHFIEILEEVFEGKVNTTTIPLKGVDMAQFKAHLASSPYISLLLHSRVFAANTHTHEYMNHHWVNITQVKDDYLLVSSYGMIYQMKLEDIISPKNKNYLVVINA